MCAENIGCQSMKFFSTYLSVLFRAFTPTVTTAQSTQAVNNTGTNWPVLQQCWRWCCRVALVQPSLLSYLEPILRLVRPTFRAHLSHARLVQVQQQDNFLHLTLKPGLRWQGFVPGQHLQLVLDINGRAVSRTFSISSSLQLYLQQGLIRLTIQQQPQGLVTGKLQQLLQWPLQGSAATRLSDRQASVRPEPAAVHISAAMGDFVLQQQQPILMLAAGSGITPIHAMLTSLSRVTQPMLLIYSYRGASQLLFADSWLELQQRFPLLQIMLIDTSKRSRLQRTEVEPWLVQHQHSQVYLCGPTLFSQHWQQQFALLGVPTTAIRQESFGQLPVVESDNTVHQITVQQAARTVMLPSIAGSLLTSLEAAGLNPAYGCRRGICMQCLCQKSQGVVRNLLTAETSDAGPGVIQLCISQPLSAVELNLP